MTGVQTCALPISVLFFKSSLEIPNLRALSDPVRRETLMVLMCWCEVVGSFCISVQWFLNHVKQIRGGLPCRSSVLLRRGKMGRSGRVNRVCRSNESRVNRVTGRVGLTRIFQTNFYFIFFNYKNNLMTTYLEKMNKIN